MTTHRASLQASLSSVDYPVSKETLVAHVEKLGVDKETMRAVRAIPLGEYGNTTEVMRAVRFDKGVEEGQSSSDKSQQARQRNKHGVAEHQTRTPTNPIVEELGENRGS